MFPACDVAALADDLPVAEQRTIEEERDIIMAAACDDAVLPSVADHLLRPSRPTDPHAPAAHLSLSSAAPVWVSVNGVFADIEGDVGWSKTLSLAGGKHLVQFGPQGQAEATGALMLSIEPGGSEAITLVPTIDGVRVLTCEDLGWAGQSEALALADLGRAGRDWVAASTGRACLARGGEDYGFYQSNSRIGARAGWHVFADEARRGAAAADRARWEQWQRRSLRGSAWMRLIEVGALGSYVVTDVFANHKELEIGPAGLPQATWPRVSVAGMLAASATRHELLVRGGHPTPKTAYLVGTVVLATVVAAREDENRWPVSGGARIFGASLALVQILSNEIVHRRARRELRRQRATRSRRASRTESTPPDGR